MIMPIFVQRLSDELCFFKHFVQKNFSYYQVHKVKRIRNYINFISTSDILDNFKLIICTQRRRKQICNVLIFIIFISLTKNIL